MYPGLVVGQFSGARREQGIGDAFECRREFHGYSHPLSYRHSLRLETVFRCANSANNPVSPLAQQRGRQGPHMMERLDCVMAALVDADLLIQNWTVARTTVPCRNRASVISGSAAP